MSNKKKESSNVEVRESKESKIEEIPSKNYVKNYFILILIFIVCICFAFYLREQYAVYEEYQLEIPVIGDTLPNITRDDLEHYVVDNHLVAVYMCTASSEACRSFEKTFKRFVEKSGITDEIVYLNLSDDTDFVSYFNDRFLFKTKLKGNYPAFVIFRDGNVDAMLQSSSKKKLSISKVQTFLELNLFYEEDEDDYEEELNNGNEVSSIEVND